jgi:putative transposase
VVTPEAKREVVGFWRNGHGISERRACRLVGLCRATQRYERQTDRSAALRVRLRELAEQRRRFGYRRLHVLLGREGVAVNLKRVRRLYREEGLSLRQRRGRRRYRGVRVVLALPVKVNQRWSMDFMSDALADGRRFRVLNVVDDFSRECLASEPGRSLTGRHVVAVLERLVQLRGLPDAIVSDNGPEFCSRVVDAWAHERQIQLRFIRPGKPIENAYVESFNGRCRDECLNEQLFVTIDEARVNLDHWRIDYNGTRPHSSLGNLTPEEFAQNHRVSYSDNHEPVRLSVA